MKIKNLQKVTLIDYPDKVACTIFLFGCNFRCGFCHNPELVVKEEARTYSEKEILDYLEKRKKYLDGICITGGEPLLTLNKEFLKFIKELGYKIKIDTNGSFPEKLKEFISEGLVDFVAMDIKASREKYSEIVNSKSDIKKIEESIKLISSSLLGNYEFRTTIIEGVHTKEEILEIAKWLNKFASSGKKIRKFVLQGFQNQGKFIDEKYQSKKNTSEKYISELKKEIDNFFEKVEIRV
ncbi:anaerobic ribonucleoside-triphosphate reductase activating protein [Candidatus Pacearchaeota archaeon]|nr:anaerobic ribonucleoside-triphosphate reductase activating protein [Candidatus Pacearchaeota archaeon]